MAASKSAGSVYHLSSLRYAEGSNSIYKSSSQQLPSLANRSYRSRLDELFEKAEDDYRPGQSSSSSLLIRSNTLSVDAPSEENSEAREGFLRTKARALLAHSVPNGGDMAEEDAMLGVQLSEVGNSIYLRNRRAKKPLTRAEYDLIRTKRRQNKEKAKAKKVSKLLEEDAATPGDEEDLEERNQEKKNSERIKMEIQVDADSLVPLLPSGSLMETIHYLAAHYYDARGMLMIRDGTAPKKSIAVNMWRVGDGSALVALAIYLEEMAKYQMTTDSRPTGIESNGEIAKDVVADELIKIQRKIASEKKRGRTKKKVTSKVTKKLIPNGWAKNRLKRRAKKTAATTLESSDGNESDTEAEEEEESSDGIDGIDESGSHGTNDTGEE